jgi:rod shape-determining protein MreC
MRAPRRTAAGSGRGRFTPGLRFFVLAVASVALMLVDHRQDHLTGFRQALSLAVHPLLVAVDLPFTAWRWTADVFADRAQLREENERLHAERLDASVRLQRLATLEAENARLRAMVDSTARVADRMLIAEILSVDLNPYRQRFNLNRGLNDGVYVGQALLDAKGVVGQVARVGPLTAEAVLITDADHAVPVTVNRNGLRTIVVGTGDSGRLRLPYLTNSADIEVGDLLVSSGLGGVFPAGYPVGRVSEVRRRPGQSFAEVVAEPAAELDRDREVLLVWSPDDEMPRRAAAAKLAEAAD